MIPQELDFFSLAIETSGRAGGVALGKGRRLVDVLLFRADGRHARELPVAAADLCARNRASPQEVGEVYISIGPGSFTGLRIGLAFTRSLAFAIKARVIPVPSLDVVAQNALRASPIPFRIVAVSDANRGHVYACEYELSGGQYRPAGVCREVDPYEFLSRAPLGTAVVGEGVAIHRAAIDASKVAVLDASLGAPDPAVLFALGAQRADRGEFIDARRISPAYVRLPEPEEKLAARSA